MAAHIYGIKNCDTMKKAFQWLDTRKIPYEFHDYKKTGFDKSVIEAAIREQGWENVLNRKGTSWRALPEGTKSSVTDAKALKLAQENPSLIRRPLMVHKGKTHIGFDDKTYTEIFGT
jgi:Spx/MgsR family transcriptional regulator